MVTDFTKFASASDIRTMLLTNDQAVEDATVLIANEHRSNYAKPDVDKSNLGYLDFDADIMLSFSDWIKAGRRLTTKQLAVARKKLVTRYSSKIFDLVSGSSIWRGIDRATVAGSVEVVMEPPDEDDEKRVIHTTKGERSVTHWVTSVSTDGCQITRSNARVIVTKDGTSLFDKTYESLEEAEEAERFISANSNSEFLSSVLKICNG